MFDANPKNLTDILGKTNRIVEGTTIKGDIISPADFRLDGHLIGNFQTDGKIVVGPAGSVTGNITCRNADIEGRFEGKILVSELLNLKSSSKIKGEVFCEKLSVEPGADFDASCNMKSQKQKLLENGKPRIEEKK